MAKVNVPQPLSANSVHGLTKNADHSVTLSAARSGLCLDATWEIEALALALPGLIPDTDENNAACLLVRGVAARIVQLNSAVMGGINDDLETVNRLHRVITLKFPEVAHV
jgi:hypothetical protein